MKTMKALDVEGTAVKSANYKGKAREVLGVTIRWLSKAGKDHEGQPAYGLRHFTVAPGGFIPAHAHFYQQTMYIESGRFECFAYDPETDEVVGSKVCGPGEAIYTDANEPHGMRNLSETEPGTFLCCICSVHKDYEAL
ncbi:MAG: cupin domain-containing protein [Desulfovibrionaceae bacterium]|nr:cupin domain-containing protein [Desulfovibrionaceae bacterium]